MNKMHYSSLKTNLLSNHSFSIGYARRSYYIICIYKFNNGDAAVILLTGVCVKSCGIIASNINNKHNFMRYKY